MRTDRAKEDGSAHREVVESEGNGRPAPPMPIPDRSKTASPSSNRIRPVTGQMRSEAEARGGGDRILEAVRAVVSAGRGAGPGSEPSSGKWWIAISGGVDSTVLLDAAARVLGTAAPERLAAVHVHHGLHPDADAWEEHCREAAERRGIAFAVRRVTVRAAGGGGGGLEASARAARYAALREAVPAGSPVLAAHHRDDQAETVLLRILRGAGPAGAAAMRPEIVLD